jgi:NADPH:quinone reductase-like Zn-dependent oxidoreductase
MRAATFTAAPPSDTGTTRAAPSAIVVADDRSVTEPVADQVVVRVHGAGLNRADLHRRRGGYPAPPGVPVDVPGLEFSGIVEAVGDQVRDLRPGDRVFGVTGGGGQAERVLAVESGCARVPDNLDLVAAGGIPETYITAHDALFSRCRLAPGERVLVHAVGSGVGTAAVQLVKAVGGTVVGTARTAEKLDRARALGLDHGICVGRGLDPRAAALEIASVCDGIEVVLDLVGGPYLGLDVAVCAPKGRIVLVGTLAGAAADLSIGMVMVKRLEIHGTVLGPRTAWEKAVATAAFSAQVVPMLASGHISPAPVVEAVLPLADAAAAYDLLASDATFGKVILDCR